MKKPIQYALVAVVLVAIAYTAHYIRQHPKVDHEPQKNIEAILEERANQAANELNSPVGKAVLAKNWVLAEKNLGAVKEPHLHFANVVRGLFIQNKTSLFPPADMNELENFILRLLETDPARDQMGYQLLSTQFFRLPLMGANFSSRQNIENTVHHDKGGAYHEQARTVALAKLVMQGTPPSDRDLKLFEDTFHKGALSHWLTVADAVRHGPTQNRLNTFVIKQWDKLDTNGKSQALGLFSNAFTVPKKADLIVSCVKVLQKGEDPMMAEASLRYLSALNDQGQLSADQKRKIFDAIVKIDDSKKSPYLAEKIKDFANKLK